MTLPPPPQGQRILLFQDRLRIGGTERQTLFLARWLQEAGHTVALLLTEPGGELWDRLSESGLEVLTLQKRSRGLPLLAPGLFRAVRAWKPDTLLAMGRTANCYAGFLQKAFPATPVVGSVRTGKRLFPLHRWSLRRVERIIVNCAWWKTRLMEEGFPGDKIHVVRNAVALDKGTPSAEAARRFRSDCGAGEGTCVFLNVAGFRRGKRQADLLRIFAQARASMPDRPWALWLVGEGAMRRTCERLAERLGLGESVRFFGYKADPSIFYAAADVAVSASREDALPNFLIEAQAAGLPFVAFDCAGVTECGRPGESCLVIKPADFGAFARALTAMAGSADRRRAFSEAGRVYAAEEFDQERQARLFEAALLARPEPQSSPREKAK